MTHAYRILLEPEVRFLEAAVERLVPTDGHGAGAREAGVVAYIDGQLAGPWGAHARQYRSGPWQDGTREQGWQSPLAPKDVYRIAIREIDDALAADGGRAFFQLPPERQDVVLSSLERGEPTLPSLSSALFFELLLRNTMEGFFADPLYGGNRDKVGWRLIGFPGIAASDYPAHLERFGDPYAVEPVSILDVVRGDADVDAQGYARHVVRIAPVR